MRNVLGTLILCLTAIPLQAGTADLQVLVTAPEEASAGDIDWSLTIINHGPDAASEVSWESGLYRGSILEGNLCSGALATLAAGARHEVDCTGTTAPLFRYERSISASVAAESDDPSSSNNVHGKRIRLITDPDLSCPF